MKKKFSWNYNEEDDVLYLHDSKKKAKESIEIEEDMVIDIDKDNNLVGLEVFYPSELFKAVNKDFPLKLLKELKDVEVELSTYRNYAIIKLYMQFNNKIIEEQLPPIPLRKYESPILSHV